MKPKITLPRRIWVAKEDRCVWFLNPHSNEYVEYIREDIASKLQENLLEFIRNIPEHLYVGLDSSGEPYLDKKKLLKELKKHTKKQLL